MRSSPPALSDQEHSKAAKSDRASTVCGWAKPSAAIAGSFLLQTASTMPRPASALACAWNAANASPAGVSGPSLMPSTPSSPITPPHSVLSRSSASSFFCRPVAVRSAARNSGT